MDKDNVPKKFAWTNRLECVEALSLECADGAKFDNALRMVRLRDYSMCASKITNKQLTALKRDVTRRVKEINTMRESANVGDIVRVPKLVPNLLGGYQRDGRKLVEAEVIQKHSLSSSLQFRVRRLMDNEIQNGNGHMIKSIVKRAVGDQ
ncbi:hypothetical protein M5X06_30815 [Paenibacillus alvei]|uniref:Phage protein n=1 Tax=Paenibacillus alvei TaxID=44250 RepID=A0ABT4H851_PAEAL|nr:hypothetical protein [Paenibacillus alvei]MCY9765161.1 hypothetical protein [Paenibacillus alvei]MCY9771168.1 hypothetical protein [Paenibacillus alvei]